MHRQLAAIVIADVVGYSRLVERDEGGFIANFRADRETVIDPAIGKHGGTIVRLAGDGLLATYSSIIEAVRSAIDIQQGMRARNLDRAGEQEIVFRIGVNLGDILVEDDNLHGEGINLAARLESLALPGTILTTDRVAEMVEGKVPAKLRFLRTQRVKNLERPVAVYSVDWMDAEAEEPAVGVGRGARRPSGDNRAGRGAERQAFAGREDEVQKFQQALAGVFEAQGQVVLLAGGAGVGKTRLCDELARLALEHNASVLWGRCREDSGAPAYWPWRQILREIERERHSAIAELAPELATLLELGAPSTAEDALALEPQAATQTRFRLFYALVELLQSLAVDRPLVLVFDDLHGADGPTLGLLEFACAELANSAIVFLGTYRDTDVPAGHRFQETLSELARLRGYEHLTIGNLDADKVAQLLAHELGEAAAAELTGPIVERTEGHALYVMETLRHLRQGGDANVLPPNLRAIIGQRLSNLPKATMEVLKIAAVMGRRFQLAGLAQVFGGDVAILLDALEAPLVANQIEALSAPGSYQFSHALIREAIYDSLTGSERLSLHRTVAQLLEADGYDPAQIAYHYHRAAPLGVGAKATEFAKRAAEQARRILAFEEAARLYAQALQTARPAEMAALTLALGLSQLAGGESLKAMSTLDQAAEQAQADEDFAVFLEAAIGLEEAIFRPGLPADLAVQRLQTALSWQADIAVEDRVRILYSLGRAYSLCGADERRWPLSAEAQALARQCGDPRLLVRALLCSAGGHGHYDPAHAGEMARCAGEAMLEAARLKEPGLQLDAAAYFIPAMIATGAADKLESAVDDLRTLANAQKQPFYIYSHTVVAAQLALARGALGQSEQLAQSAMEVCRWLPGQDGEGVFGIQMFHIRREQAALAQLAPVVEFFVRTNPDAARWRPGLALIHVELEQFDNAAALLDSLGQQAFAELERDATWQLCIAYLCEVSARLRQERHSAALYDLLLPYADQNIALQMVACLGSAQRYLGLLMSGVQDWPRAEKHLRAAIARNERQGFVTWLAHSQLDYAAMLLARDHKADRAGAAGLAQQALAAGQRASLPLVQRRAESLLHGLSAGPAAAAGPPSKAVDALSRRELQVLAQIAAGKDNKHIGEALFISSNTVAAHVRNILAKTGTSNRAEATAYALQNGLLER